MKLQLLMAFGLGVSLIGCGVQETAESKAVGHSSAKLKLLCQAVKLIYIAQGYLPENQTYLYEIITNPQEGYLRDYVLSDGWGHTFHYARTGEFTATLWSDGRDVTDKTDDIRCSLTFDLQRQMVIEAFKKTNSPRESITERPFFDYVQTR